MNDFSPFKVGTVFNTLNYTGRTSPTRDHVTIKFPARLEAMALDPSKITHNNNLIYPAGQIDVSVEIFKNISVSIDSTSSDITITSSTGRPALVRHAAILMREALNVRDGLIIDVKEDVSLRHCGLGSSSGLIAGVMAAVNEIYGKPVSPLDLCRYSTQNHGEEIDGKSDELVPVQCIGGSAVCGNTEGSLIILAGEATPIFNMSLPDSYRVVVGVPEDFEHPDSRELMQLEEQNMAGFSDTGEQFGAAIAYRLIHQVIPQLVHQDLTACKDLVFDYRWDMGSIQNCSFVYPRMNEIADALRVYKDDSDAKLISLSSVGPGFFVVTDKPEKFERVFNGLGMKTLTANLCNTTYTVEERLK